MIGSAARAYSPPMRQMLAVGIPVAALATMILLAPDRGERPPEPRRAPAAFPVAEPPPPPPEVEAVAAPPPAERPRPTGPVADRVDALAAELALDDAQRRAYHALLETYALRFDALHRATDWTRAGSRLQFAADHRKLQEEFDLLVVRLLTPEQARTYAGLPEWDRSADLGSVALELEASRRR